MTQVTYCTARISARDNASECTSKVTTRPPAVPHRKDRPKLVDPGGPVKVKAGAMPDDPHAIFMVSVAGREAKGSDVDVATHLLTDVFKQKIDAAVVILNDSDLALPI